MNAELLIFLGGVVAAVLFVVDRMGKRLADSIPPDAILLLELVLDVADTMVQRTPTTADDDLIDRIREAFGLEVAPEPPAEPPMTAEQIAARLDGNGSTPTVG